MDFLEKFDEAGKEISKLRSRANQADSHEKEIKKLEENIIEENEIWEFLLPHICPEEIDRIKKLSKKENHKYPDYDKIESAKKFLAKPKALGYSIRCTYSDPCADSGADCSKYGLFLNIDDGRDIFICSLGQYEGVFRSGIPTAKETIIRKFFKRT